MNMSQRDLMTIFHGAAGRDGGRWKREIQKVFFLKMVKIKVRKREGKRLKDWRVEKSKLKL